MEGLSSFAGGFLLSLTFCMDLGIVNVALMRMGIERGFRPAFLFGLGSCIGDFIYLALALLGLTAVFQYGAVRWAMWIGGTLVLLYFTYTMLRETFRPKARAQSDTPLQTRKPWKDFAVGIGMALSSPTLILSFAVIAGPVAAGMDFSNRANLAWFLAGFLIAGVLWSLLLAWTSSRSGRVAGTGFIRGVSLVSALLFLYFAVKVFWDGLQDLL